MVSDPATVEATAAIGIFKAFFVGIAAESVCCKGGYGANLVAKTLNTRHSG